MNNWSKAFYFIEESLLSTNATSVTDFITKLRVAKTFETSRHSLRSFVFYVIPSQRLNSFFWPPIVVLINWITALFLNAWPSSNYVLNAPNDLFKVRSTNPANPFSNLFAFLYFSSSILSGNAYHFLKPITTNPAFDISNLFKKFLWISTILRFNLNLLSASLIWATLPLCSKLFNTLRTFFFFYPSIF